jgi:hypothetical protein
MERQFKFQILYFIAGFAFGLLYVYLSTPHPKIVYKFPTPFNANTEIYKDAVGNCYKYDAEKVPCSGNVKSQPIVS